VILKQNCQVLAKKSAYNEGDDGGDVKRGRKGRSGCLEELFKRERERRERNIKLAFIFFGNS